MYKWLKFSRRILLHVLHGNPDCKVTEPKPEEINQYIDAIERKEPRLSGQKVWAAADGLKINVEQSCDWYKQAANYNSWKEHTFVNCVFAFAPDGKIRICVINAPGTWHDSKIAQVGIYQKMEQIFDEHGARVVVDAAFMVTKKGYLIKTKTLQKLADGREAFQLNEGAKAVRQLSEHGMRMIGGLFPRLKDNVKLEEFGDRRIILHLMVMLYNWQTRKVGINHILNSYMSKTSGFVSYRGKKRKKKRASYYSYTHNGELVRISATANDLFGAI